MALWAPKSISDTLAMHLWAQLVFLPTEMTHQAFDRDHKKTEHDGRVAADPSLAPSM